MLSQSVLSPRRGSNQGRMLNAPSSTKSTSTPRFFGDSPSPSSSSPQDVPQTTKTAPTSKESSPANTPPVLTAMRNVVFNNSTDNEESDSVVDNPTPIVVTKKSMVIEIDDSPYGTKPPPQETLPSPKSQPMELSLRKSVKTELPGQRNLNEFEINTTIGTGSFGRVWLVRLACEPIKHKGFFALKVMKKADVLRLKQVEHIVNEANLLQTLNHPFIVSQVCAFQDARRLYLLLEYVPGGELFNYLRNERVIPDKSARFYACEIILCYHYLHGQNIVYRDLKPENLLLTRTGHVKLADFGFAKVVNGRTWTLCGTPEYLAPEVIQNRGHGFSVDWWALGVLIYEMLAGYPPFVDDSALQVYQKIIKGHFEFPDFFEPRVRQVISGLLTSDLSKRLGCLKNGADDVMRCEWFAKIKWQAVLDRLVPAPYFPPIENAMDTSNFDVYEDPDTPAPVISPADDKKFEKFGAWVTPESPLWFNDVE